MSKKLIIKFRCLCFFARDKAGKRMHVLAPATCGCEDGGAGIEKHRAYLVFPRDGGPLADDGTFMDGGAGGAVDYVDMEGWSLTLPGTGTPATLGFDPSTVVDLDAVTQDVLSPALVSGPRDARISARVTLPSGRMDTVEAPGIWKFDGQTMSMARDVIWVVDGLPDEPLVVRRKRFEVGADPAAGAEEIVAQVEANVRGEFRLEFHHSMEGDFGRPLQTRDPGRAARHFKAFYALYDNPAHQPIPEFVTSPDVGVVGCIPAGGG